LLKGGRGGNGEVSGTTSAQSEKTTWTIKGQRTLHPFSPASNTMQFEKTRGRRGKKKGAWGVFRKGNENIRESPTLQSFKKKGERGDKNSVQGQTKTKREVRSRERGLATGHDVH